MKKILLGLCVLACSVAQAQQKAVTENGEEVLLYDNGTWTPAGGPIEVKEIPTSDKTFKKGKKASFLVKSNRVGIGFYLNPKKWSFKKATDNPEAEFEIQLKGGDLYGMMISEKMEIPLETLRNIAVENGRSAAPDLHIAKEEYRMVNGIKVLMLQLDGTAQGIKFSYYGYYYSSDKGTVQFITYTSQNLMLEYRGDCEELLNGLVEL